MKTYTYPAIIYYNDEDKEYIISLIDLGLIAEAESVEEAHKKIKECLNAFLECAFVFGSDIPEPSQFEKIVEKHPKDLVVLVETNLDNKNKPIK